MNTYFRVSIIVALFLIVIGILAFFQASKITYVLDNFDKEIKIINREEKNLIFTGDIMLARDVERRQRSLNPGNSFSNLEDLFKDKIVVGNFEASVPAIHDPTPSMGMKFSVTPQNLKMLDKAGFTHLSLANNHTLDHGVDGYKNTVSQIVNLGLATGGYPTGLSSSSVSYIENGERKFALVYINATYGYPEKAKWQSYISWAKSNSEVVIVYIHWGEEYELIHNAAQENLAKAFIDGGVDLIIGHHPHVVQDIGIYKGKLIFYSLGNLVFDQYWNSDVSEGLVLELQNSEMLLHPVESRTVKVQPREMVEKERNAFFQSLASRSDEALREQILAGALELQF